ncbi:putative nuclear matrix constituent protein 1 (NMCP1) [Oryza sativa Japonica Group]|uniref:Nuclear matrix constituent protein 1b n=2 Tax=Oryza sativa subsp. japonica TaxID=39947 RepID=NMCPB_ORYSJ|nr:nuclear matrix constituent protein 1b [Oryza sativa Japonica Group]Q0JJ05.1 RecName: Full=Nuclear matrix constituent protein 1b; Short=OsNMCP1b; AltName: Full=Nuclear matrix constituent protein 1; Short=OsNMCP1 [Oryza sativa Japonica Group]EAZ13665.1 hypothetical protein OsJ_03582 [Oryza sativa Japonica Group]KAF2952460.1 hypothetical protein DAI22_01g338400 [Oryza sativa Japonica Group]BAC10761.1 putative nuclear matrix constituent protein 1 (NMCP1) [Oryza sativa Japonica Group]BAC78597.1 |eukprot:NP_001044359.1 Os01g0767000 [Oryza sativa Japonica Group]
MASPRSAGGVGGGGGGGGGSGGAAAGDDAIWSKLREAGFDEESLKRRDKAALIAYISRLESEIYQYQHNLGLVLMERKELTSKHEQLRAASESAEIMHKRERAAQQSALAEARKKEENLKKSLGIQKECVANLEKALHDMRGETAETKVSYESKLAEALQLMEAAHKKFDEAEEKLLLAKSLEAESIRTHNAALRSLHDIDDREDQLRRDRISCELENEAKEKEISLQRKSLNDMKKILHEKEEVLLKEQALLNQRDENILERLAYVTHSEKRVEEEKNILEAERKVLLEEKYKLELKMEAIVSREEALIQKESLLDKRESELLILQETIASKERAEIERLNQEQAIALERRKHDFESEMANKQMSFDAAMEVTRNALHQRECALSEQESVVVQRSQNLDLQLAELASKEKALAGRSDELKEEEEKLLLHREAIHNELQKEREEIQRIKSDLEKEKAFFEEEKREAIQAQQDLAITQADRDELLTLQMKLKEEIDSLRAQKRELMADADRLQAEKERFEIEWELIDEKKEELQKEAIRIAEERRAITEYLKNESDIIKQEKDNLRVQFKSNSETLSREHKEFMSKMQQEHASWLSKIQQERQDLKRDIDIQRVELLNSAKARQMEIDSYLREREEEFEQKKAKELEHINSQKEMINTKLEHVAVELQKLKDERKEATLERERREQELSEIKGTIEALNNQREKLQEQRKLLHSDREAITVQIQQLNVLEELKIDSENKQLSLLQHDKSKLGSDINVKDNHHDNSHSSPKQRFGRKLDLSPVSTPISWVRKCAQVIFKRSPEKSASHDQFVQNGVPKKVGDSVDVEDVNLDFAKVGQKRLNHLVSCDQTEVLEPKRKHRRSTIQKVNGGEITSNCLSALEEKCSKNEHDEAPLGLSNTCKEHEYGDKGPENLTKPGEPASSVDVPYVNGIVDNSDSVQEEPSVEATVSATETSNVDGPEDNNDSDEEDEEEEEEKTSSAKKLWRFLIT